MKLFLVLGLVPGQGQMCFSVSAENSDDAVVIATKEAGGNLQVLAIADGPPKNDADKVRRFNMVMGRL